MNYDKAAEALAELLSEVYSLVGEVDELESHPLLCETERELVDEAFKALEEASNLIHDRLEVAQK